MDGPQPQVLVDPLEVVAGDEVVGELDDFAAVVVLERAEVEAGLVQAPHWESGRSLEQVVPCRRVFCGTQAVATARLPGNEPVVEQVLVAAEELDDSRGDPVTVLALEAKADGGAPGQVQSHAQPEACVHIG